MTIMVRTRHAGMTRRTPQKKAPCATEDAWGFVIREAGTGYFFFAVFFFAAFLAAFLAGAASTAPALAAARFSSMAA